MSKDFNKMTGIKENRDFSLLGLFSSKLELPTISESSGKLLEEDKNGGMF